MIRCATLFLFLAVGYALYRRRWPEGLLPVEPDREKERLRRVGRRRVLPLPPPEGPQR
jgi:hypothetical protein